MKLVVVSASEDLIATVRQCAEAGGHELGVGVLGASVPEDIHLVIVDGLEALIEMGRLRAHVLAIVTSEELSMFPECPMAIREFQVKPVNVPELSSRIYSLCTRPSADDETRHNILGQAVESSADIFELTTPDAVFEYVNPAFEKVTGYSASQVQGRTVASCLRGGNHPVEFYQDIGRTLAAGAVWSGVLISKDHAGRTVHLESTIAPVIDAKGDMTHHVAVKRDITDRLMREQALAETNKALEQARDAAVSASRAKSEFLANMSHELRTPLNAIIGYSEMLIEDYGENEQTVKDLNRIRSAGTHLLSLINDVLDLSKIEAEHIELSPETFAFAEFVESISETVVPLVRDNNNRFELVLKDPPSELYVDKMRVRQILLNLLSNACKFTKDGDIKLIVESETSDRGRLLHFRVQDTGIGIDAEQRGRLFQAFVQADSSTTRKFGGTGLGLVISKRFAEMMQGSIEIESEPGKGSTFSLTIPLRSRDDLDNSLRTGRRGDKPLILLIDDDIPVHDLFTRYLSARGFQVHCASTGPDGIRDAAELLPQAIVLDVRMPGMSGWEVLSTLKLSERTSDIPVVMMTIMEQKDVGKALGAADYLVKPIEPRQLTQVLRRYVAKAGAQILVVEDDEPTRELMCRTLASAGHTTLEAENGQIALDILHAEQPDLILLDLMMPVMDGFTFLDKYHHDTTLSRIPTIIATARTLSEFEKRELLTVSERIIQKGAFTREKLLESICEQVRQLIAERAADDASPAERP